MTEQPVTRIMLRQYRTAISYSEQETAAASHLSVNTIHHFRALDLIGGEEMDGELRYSGEEVTRLRRIRRLQYELVHNHATFSETNKWVS